MDKVRNKTPVERVTKKDFKQLHDNKDIQLYALSTSQLVHDYKGNIDYILDDLHTVINTPRYEKFIKPLSNYDIKGNYQYVVKKGNLIAIVSDFRGACGCNDDLRNLTLTFYKLR